MNRPIWLAPLALSDVSIVEPPDGPKRSRFLAVAYGRFTHRYYGELEFTEESGREYERNFNGRVLGRDIFIDYGHNPDDRAAGKVLVLQATPQGIYYETSWTPRAQKEIEDGEWNYHSAWLAPVWKHPKSGREFRNVALGGALTNVPSLLQEPGEPELSVRLHDFAFPVEPGTPLDPQRRIWAPGGPLMFEKFLAAFRKKHNVPDSVTDEQLAEQAADSLQLAAPPAATPPAGPAPTTPPAPSTVPAGQGTPPPAPGASGPPAPPAAPPPAANGSISLADFERFRVEMLGMLTTTQARADEALRLRAEDQAKVQQTNVERMLSEAIYAGRLPPSAKEKKEHWDALIKWGSSDPEALKTHLLSLSPPAGFVPRGFPHTEGGGGAEGRMFANTELESKLEQRCAALEAEGKDPIEAYSLAMSELDDQARMDLLGVPPEAYLNL